ncbi:Cwc2 protein [Starmerella bacillaris]|uniref:Cwc2 protein n=1 Tax=Starmerella bacillaris TaxID=1247836 RepID=A0AAV5RGB7_STABA|nr:Cwc2 protein [Starmerella bacillaris]
MSEEKLNGSSSLQKPGNASASVLQVSTNSKQVIDDNDNATGVYNQWYQNWSGETKKRGRVRSKTKLDLEKDTCETLGKSKFICLHFARGSCKKGANCPYLHRIPAAGEQFPLGKDCFGRLINTDGMRGIRSPILLLKDFKRTKTSAERMKKLQKLAFNEFSKYGDVGEINLSNGLSIEYKYQANSDFAFEAMNNQTLTGRETLKIAYSPENKALDDQIRAIVRRVLHPEKTQTEKNSIESN